MIKSKIFCALFFSLALYSFAAEVQVPDLETRIRNSGNVIPENALPYLSSPRPSVLPEAPEISGTLIVPVLTVPKSPDSVHSVDADLNSFIPFEAQPTITGSALLGAGSPGTIRGELSLIRSALNTLDTSIPALVLDFHYDSADGYGLKSPGSGYFDRSVQLAGMLASGDRSNIGKFSWFAGLDLRERTDGFQGLNTFYYSLNTRSVYWDSGLSDSILAADLLTWGLSFSGSSLSVFADSPGGNSIPPDPQALTFIPNANRYQFLPTLYLNFNKELSGKTIPGFIAASLTGNYSFTGMADRGEFHKGGGDLSFAYRYKRVETALFGGVHYDSNDGVLFPFSLRFLYDNLGSVFSHLSVEGGLSSEVSDPAEIRKKEPFARADILPLVFSDWFGTLGVNVSPFETVSIASSLSYKTTAFSREGWYLSSDAQENGLLNIEMLHRDSLHLSSKAVWTPSFFSLSFGYSGEYLDPLYQTNLHLLSFGADVFDTGEFSKWKAGVSSVFSLDTSDIPLFDIYGTFKPAKNISILVTVKDAIPPLYGKNRERSGGYIARSGEFLLSARLDF